MTAGKSLTLSDHLSKSCVQIGISAEARKDVLDHLAREAVAAGLVDNHNLFLENLIKRESEMSTGVGRGLAVPHAEVSGAKETFVIGATLQKPVEYLSIDEEPVDIVFLIGGKPGEVGLHLQLLARIARLARQPEFLARLRGQKDVDGFVSVVEEAEASLYSAPDSE